MKKMTLTALGCGIAGLILMGLGVANASSLDELASWPEVKIGNSAGFFIRLANPDQTAQTRSSQQKSAADGPNNAGRIENDDSLQSEWQEYIIDQTVSAIQIEAERADLIIEKSEDSPLNLTTQNLPPKEVEENGREISWKMDGQTLKIKVKDQSGQVGLDSVRQPAVRLALPARLDVLKLETGLGQIEVNDISASQTALSTSLGEIQLADSQFDRLSASTALGNVEISGCKIEQGIFESSMGNVEIQNSTFVHVLEAASSLGNVQVRLPKQGQSDLADADVTLETNHGKITYENEPVQSDYGTATFTRKNPAAALHIHLETASGDISLEQY